MPDPVLMKGEVNEYPGTLPQTYIWLLSKL